MKHRRPKLSTEIARRKGLYIRRPKGVSGMTARGRKLRGRKRKEKENGETKV